MPKMNGFMLYCTECEYYKWYRATRNGEEFLKPYCSKVGKRYSYIKAHEECVKNNTRR